MNNDNSLQKVQLNSSEVAFAIKKFEDSPVLGLYIPTLMSEIEMQDRPYEKNVILNDSMIKKAQYTYTSDSENSYQAYLELTLTQEGQAKLDEIRNDYAVLATEVSEEEAKTKDTNTTENTTTERNGIATTNTSAAFTLTVNAIIIAPKTINGERRNRRSTIFTPDCT